MKLKKRFAAFFLFFVILTGNVSAYAGVIEGADVEEKAQKAGFDLYETIAILVDNYAGTKLSVEQLYEAALRGISEELDENSYPLTEEEYLSFSNDTSGIYEGIGIVISDINFDFAYVDEVFKNSPAETAGLKAGDVFGKINGTDVSKSSADEIRDIIYYSQKTVDLDIKRDGSVMSFSVDKASIKLDTVIVRRMEDLLDSAKGTKNDKMRYVQITTFGDSTYAEFSGALKQLKKEGVEYIVLDLRDNGGGYLSEAEGIAGLIVPSGAIYHIKDAYGETFTVDSKLESPPFKHIAVLTNAYTASASELLASAIQDANGATLIGQRTYGKGTIQDIMPILTNGAFKFTVAEYLRRNGGAVNKVGVTPDITVNRPDFIEYYAADENGIGEVLPDVLAVMAYLGYKVDVKSEYNGDVKIVFQQLQVQKKLKPTGMPDETTVDALNEELYRYYLDNDEELEEAYKLLNDKITDKIKSLFKE